ncbi:TRAP transporter small permease [Falsigemmobacter faecalis]|uniref:TRAP transporter small permease protein n=1 Tax=Falsigemmobacter faecalis TaxID=2488730 RepID=A0A3P3DIY9_9RHOB|nr:TRAP transporter small permease [Falsigemmobacter faecalis]RRH74231.1 TRAP transporter small permease [Falsigemmobacter faecalis]
MQHDVRPPDNSPVLRLMTRFETALVAVSAAALAAIMLIVVADVAGRYFFDAPFSWSYNVIGLWLMTAVFFLALPDTLNHHGHIAVDVFQHMLPKPVMHLGLALGYGASIWVVALICKGGWARFVKAWVNDEHIQALVPISTWVPYALLVIGTAALVLRCVVRVIGHLASLVTGRDLAHLPPPPVTGSVQEDVI